MRTLKKAENCVENFPQTFVISMILALINSETITVEAMKAVIRPSVFVYASAVWSLKSVVQGGVEHLKAQNGGFLPLMGQLIWASHTLISVISRLAALLIYFTPSLGLFNVSIQWTSVNEPPG